VVVAVSMANNVDVDGDANDDDWTVRVPADGMRFVDGDGLDITGPAAISDAETFEIIEEGDNDDLDLESSDEDPDASTLEISEDDKVEHLVFAFDLSAEDSENDVTINDINVAFNVGGTDGTSLDNFIDDFRMEIDGTSVDAESYTGSGVTATVNFDFDGDVEVPEDGSVTALVYATFEDAGSSFSDATISASTTPGSVDAEGADDVTVDGSQKNGNVQTVRTTGVTLAAEPSDGTDTSDSEHVTAEAVDDNYGTMFLEFDLTGFGDDLWVKADDAVKGASSTAGLAYQIYDVTAGAATTSGSVTIDYDIDGADEDNGYFELEDGETYTVTVTVDYNPVSYGVDRSYRLDVLTVGYNDTEDTTADTTASPDDATEYRSDAVTIQS